MPVGSKFDKRTDEDWQAINDAETLARAQLIQGDKKRLAAAIAWAKELAKEENQELEAMNKIAELNA